MVRSLAISFTLLLGSAGAAVASGSPGLALAPADVPQLRPAAASLASLRAEIGAPLPRVARTPLRAAPAGASAFRGRGLRVTSGALLLPDRAAAARVVRAWRATTPRPRVSGAVLLQPFPGGVRALVAVERAVGLVRVTGRTGARERAVGLATVLAARLRASGAESAWDATLARVRPDGTVSKDTALEAIALALGPVPGVPPPPGPRGDIGSATFLLGWIRPHWSALTPAQRTAVAELLDVPEDLEQSGSGAVAGLARVHETTGGRRLPLQPDPALDALADRFADRFADLLGEPLRMGVRIGWVNGLDASGDAHPRTIDDRLARTADAQHTCRIRVGRGGDNRRAAYLANTVAHEVFHCYQFQLAPLGWQRTGNAWLTEGQAEWAANTVAPIDPDWAAGHPDAYFGRPDESLFARTYTAGFFWGRLNETTGSIWRRLGPALDQPTNEGAFAAAGAGAPGFLEAWASSLPRLARAGAAWTTADPLVVPPGRFPAASIDIAGPVHLDKEPFTNQLLRLRPNGGDNVVRIELTKGWIRASDGREDIRFGPGGEAYVCLGGRCACPAGEELTVPTLRTAEGPLRLAVSGGDSGTLADVFSLSIDDLCTRAANDECATSRPLRMPGTRAEFIAWYARASAEATREAGALFRLHPRYEDLTRRLDGTRELEPSLDKDALVNSLTQQINALVLEGWSHACRFNELVVQGNRVNLRSVRLGILARSRPVVDAQRDWISTWSRLNLEFVERGIVWPSRYPPF